MKRLFVISLLSFLSLMSFSQEVGKDNEINVDNNGNLLFINQIVGGFNIGASVPIPISNRMSDFSWTPPFAPYLGWKITLSGYKSFGMSSGLIFNYKGMNAKASVYQLYTEVVVDGVETKGYFTGRNETDINNLYITFPIEFCVMKPHYRVNFGASFNYAVKKEFTGEVKDGYLRRDEPIGDRIEIDSSPYNFDDEVRNFDIALSVSYERKILNKLSIACGLNWSLTPLLNSDFTGMPYKMYNIYAHIGLSYYLK